MYPLSLFPEHAGQCVLETEEESGSPGRDRWAVELLIGWMYGRRAEFGGGRSRNFFAEELFCPL